ncbi:S-layer homology domain-containing protein [Paenibacillus septentrionalis]|uniref:S-layer homology domain-containing protein n=1 Tax=Paenibacillus septentrionalis TaxID=429342 RepID=A0ABW1V1W3_9BACL
MEKWTNGAKMGLVLLLTCALFLMNGNAVLVPQQVLAASGNGVGTAAISQSDYSVSNDYVVWLSKDENGYEQIYAQHLVSGDIQAITNRASGKDVPAIYGTKVVWADKGVHDSSSAYWDIYSYDLATRQEVKLNKQSGVYANPSIHEQGAVWTEARAYDVMIYHDFATGQQFSLGEGRYPVLRDGQVVYKHARDGGLSVLDLLTGAKRSIIQLGSGNYVDWFVASDEYILFKQKSSSLGSKFAIASLQDRTAQVTDLTEMSVKQEEYTFMSIGETQAVFIENIDGRAALRGVQLSDAKLYTIEQPQANSRYVGMVGDQLVFQRANGELATKAIDAEQGGNAPGNPGVPNPPTTGTDGSLPGQQEESKESTFVIGQAGGIAEAAEGAISLTFAADTFAKDTTITIANADYASVTLQDEAGRVMMNASKLWRIGAEQPFAKTVQLKLAYASDRKWQEQSEKLGIYRYDNGHFVYVGGVTRGDGDDRIRAAIQEPGLYAVLLRDISFADLSAGHWATAAIEVLSARGIVNGMSETRFAPSETLTRAQFSKMLVSALGLAPQYPSQPSFSDVQPHSWSYGWIEAAASAGIVEGSQGRFNPEHALTREEMMTMLVRAVEVQTSESLQVGTASDLQQFIDHDVVSKWAQPYVIKVLQLELVQGSGKQLKPLDISSRAEAAVVIYRLLDRLNRL